MKWIVFTLVSTFMLSITDQNIDKIFSAIGNGDIEALSEYLAEKVEISINNRAKLVDKGNAEAELLAFYREYEAISYENVHRVDSPGKDTFYTIGKLITRNKNFRVSIYLIRLNGEIFIREIRFDQSSL